MIEQFTADIKPSDLMAPDKVVGQALKGMEHDTWEVFPGLATALRYMSRIAPGFMIKQLSKGLVEALPRAEPDATPAR